MDDQARDDAELTLKELLAQEGEKTPELETLAKAEEKPPTVVEPPKAVIAEGDYVVLVRIHRTSIDDQGKAEEKTLERAFPHPEPRKARFRARRYIRDQGLSIRDAQQTNPDDLTTLVVLKQELVNVAPSDEVDPAAEAEEVSDDPTTSTEKASFAPVDPEDEENWA